MPARYSEIAELAQAVQKACFIAETVLPPRVDPKAVREQNHGLAAGKVAQTPDAQAQRAQAPMVKIRFLQALDPPDRR
jgi:hypothetical protein